MSVVGVRPSSFYPRFHPLLPPTLSSLSAHPTDLHLLYTHTRTRTHSNGVCLAQGGLSMHSKLRINAIVSVPQKLSNGGRVCLCVCVITCIPGQEVKDDALCSNYAPTSTFGDSTSARIRADTHTGSKVPRLPPETLCCSHIVCEEKERRPSASHPRRPIQLFVLDYTQITWGSRSRLL